MENLTGYLEQIHLDFNEKLVPMMSHGHELDGFSPPALQSRCSVLKTMSLVKIIHKSFMSGQS